MTNGVQVGDDGGKSQGGALRRGVIVGALATARDMPHGVVDGGWSHGGGRADDSMGSTDGDDTDGGGAQGGDGEPQSQGDTENPEGQVRADGSGNLGGVGNPEDRGRAGATEDQCGAGRKEEAEG